MKGVVFTEFLDLVEDKFGYEMVDRIIVESELSSSGAYTAVGTYPFAEMVKLLGRLSHNTNIPIDQLLYLYGKHFFSLWLKSYPHFIEQVDNAFQLFESIDHYIHIEVQKLYPNAELPHFDSHQLNEYQLEMIYTSPRKMADFAQGLIESSMAHYGQKGTIEKTILNPEGTKVSYLVTI